MAAWILQRYFTPIVNIDNKECCKWIMSSFKKGTFPGTPHIRYFTTFWRSNTNNPKYWHDTLFPFLAKEACQAIQSADSFNQLVGS